MRGRVNKRTVDGLASSGSRDVMLWDVELPRFGVKVSPGGSKSYIVQYRARGRVRRLTIGRHGQPWTPDTARGEALRVLADVASGADPAGVKVGARGAARVGELLDRFLSDHAETKLRASTRNEYRKTIAAVLRPALGPLPVAAVTSDDVARLHQRMRKTPVHANRALALTAKVFHMAEQWGLRPAGSNPARTIEKYREVKRTRRLALDEFGRLGAVLAAAEAGPLEVPGAKGTTTRVHIGPFALAAIKLLLFTGARKSEILTATWAMLDRERSVLRLVDSKTGPKNIILPAAALAVLDGLSRIEGNAHILPGARDGQPLVNISKPLTAILAAAKLDDDGVSLHVLRHSFASIGVDEGLSLPVVGKLLGHSQASTTQRYSHISDPLRAAAESIGARLTAAMAPRPDMTPPAPLRRGERVTLTAAARATAPGRGAGTVARQNREGFYLIRWDGRRTVEQWPPEDLLRAAAGPAR